MEFKQSVASVALKTTGAIFGITALIALSFLNLTWLQEMPAWPKIGRGTLSILIAGTGLAFVHVLVINSMQDKLKWFYTVTTSRLDKLENPQTPNILDGQQARWPWGNHHTEALGHLEAAAQRWWRNYNPAEPDTAPKNEWVSDWLRTERGVTKEKANAIASILRADGLRTGPRH